MLPSPSQHGHTQHRRDDQPYALRVAIFRRRKDGNRASSREQSNPLGDRTEYSEKELANTEFAEYVEEGEALDKKKAGSK
eukprot:SAG31_NODE_2937_length_4889_cov_3.571399_5_plen_80_part_00